MPSRLARYTLAFMMLAAWAVLVSSSTGVLAQQGGGTVSSTGMKRSTKTLIFAGVAGAFLGIAVGIDHSVKNVTPSSLGERHDEDVFKK